MQHLESGENTGSRLVEDEVDTSSQHASIGGRSNCYESLLLESPHNDNSLPVPNDGDFSALLEAGPGDAGPASEVKGREVAKRGRHERR